VGHRRAKLTFLGRVALVERVEVLGWPVAQAAESMNVSRATAYKWLRRWREEGHVGLEDRTSRPRRCPHALPPSRVQAILRARRRLRHGPHRLAVATGHPRSTIYAVPRRHGLSRLAHADRATGAPIRYEKDRPGELVHVDVKKLGRIPPGGGHRMLGRKVARASRRKRGWGYDFLHAALDDHSRVAYVEVHPDERGETCAGFLLRAAGFFAEHGVRVEAIMTDNAKNYVLSRAFAAAVESLEARHAPTPPYRPALNGKVERFNRTLLEEWAYRRLYRSNAARLRELPRWVEFYNRLRHHTALRGRPPISRL
jgi:transposase InsO family protein